MYSIIINRLLSIDSINRWKSILTILVFVIVIDYIDCHRSQSGNFWKRITSIFRWLYLWMQQTFIVVVETFFENNSLIINFFMDVCAQRVPKLSFLTNGVWKRNLLAWFKFIAFLVENFIMNINATDDVSMSCRHH